MDSSGKSCELQGPRPPALSVSKKINSSKIMKKKKKPLQNRSRCSSPVIVYLRSPKIIHVKPQDFMGLVQRLTGNHASMLSSSSSSSTSCVMVGEEYNKGQDQGKYESEVNSASGAAPALMAAAASSSVCPSFFVNIYGDSWLQEFGQTL